MIYELGRQAHISKNSRQKKVSVMVICAFTQHQHQMKIGTLLKMSRFSFSILTGHCDTGSLAHPQNERLVGWLILLHTLDGQTLPDVH